MPLQKVGPKGYKAAQQVVRDEHNKYSGTAMETDSPPIKGTGQTVPLMKKRKTNCTTTDTQDVIVLSPALENKENKFLAMTKAWDSLARAVQQCDRETTDACIDMEVSLAITENMLLLSSGPDFDEFSEELKGVMERASAILQDFPTLPRNNAETTSTSMNEDKENSMQSDGANQ